jgi:hypothetical protein
MKFQKSIAILSMALIAIFALSSWGEDISDSHDRKLDRFVAKSFGSKLVKKHLVAIPDSLQVFNENNFYQLSLSDSLVGYMSFNRANSCRVGGCVAFDSANRGSNFDPFYFATIYEPNMSIRQVKILEYYSDFGYEVSSKKWLKQFIGKSSCEKDLEDKIDGISGATISVKSLIQEVNGNCEVLETLYP